ncbi:perosamine synthetase [Tamaricihabitans halophyticus]|uniref:Perosamine synthetase n=1 Tax=Tamaricihabitans halophyticus TaxID=1262583 RepID=A0A4R2R4X3_9PSEU|nr:DegT/DnrJ/EryC1/StrS family aminotransferase [Tamaricihabitans halophyticus]TCP56778.1 perosamine synthetase [Tamaricihabitans halophyticus]
MTRSGKKTDLTDFPRWPRFDDEDIQAVTDVARSNRLSQISNSAVTDFEAALAAYVGVEHCIAVNSGTAAIQAALAGLQIGNGDQVIAPAHTFIGTASPILHQGAEPVIVDVDPVSYCIDPAAAEAAITPHTKAIIAVHLNGQPAAMRALAEVGARHGVPIIEDVAQSPGARYAGKPLGSHGVVGCFSFWEDKIITTGGEGGAVVTDDGNLAARIRMFRQHGEKQLEGTRLYCSHELGYNYRMTAMQAALGLTQLAKLDSFVDIRRRNAKQLTAALESISGLQLPKELPDCYHSYWKYVCRVDTGRLGITIDEFTKQVQELGAPAFRRYPVPLHRQPVFSRTGMPRYHCPVADALSAEAFSLPIHPAVGSAELELMSSAIHTVLGSTEASNDGSYGDV